MAGEIKYGIALYLRDQASAGIKAVAAEAKSLGEAAEVAGKYAGVGLLAMAGAATASVFAAGQAEEAERKLADALRGIGDGSPETQRALADLASEMQRLTVHDDEAITGLESLAVTLGVQPAQMRGVIQGAIGLSQALGIDLQSALRAVINAQNGEYGMLARYVPALKDASSEAERQAVVQQLLASGWESATGKAQTFMGQVAQLKNSLDDLLEAVGNVILGGSSWQESLDNLKGKIEAVTGWLNGMTTGTKEVVVDLALLTAGALAAVVGVSALVKVCRDVKVALTALHITTWAAAGSAAVYALALASLVLGLGAVLEYLGVVNLGICDLAESTATSARITYALARAWLEAYYGARLYVAYMTGQFGKMKDIAQERKDTLEQMEQDLQAKLGELSRKGGAAQVSASKEAAEQIKKEVAGIKEAAQAAIEELRKAGAAGPQNAPAGVPAAAGPAAPSGAPRAPAPGPILSAPGPVVPASGPIAPAFDRTPGFDYAARVAAVGRAAERQRGVEAEMQVEATPAYKEAAQKVNNAEMLANLLAKAGYAEKAEGMRKEATAMRDAVESLLERIVEDYKVTKDEIAELKTLMRRMSYAKG